MAEMAPLRIRHQTATKMKVIWKYYANSYSSVVDLSKTDFYWFIYKLLRSQTKYHIKVMEALDLANKNGDHQSQEK